MSDINYDKDIKQPTVDQCTAREKVYEDDDTVAYAIWFPQMGGYCAMCVAIFDKQWYITRGGGAVGGCVDLLVWHNGDFPFSDEDQNPRKLHLCDPHQFIDFGKALAEINDKREVSEGEG